MLISSPHINAVRVDYMRDLAVVAYREEAINASQIAELIDLSGPGCAAKPSSRRSRARAGGETGAVAAHDHGHAPGEPQVALKWTACSTRCPLPRRTRRTGRCKLRRSNTRRWDTSGWSTICPTPGWPALWRRTCETASG